MRRQDAYYLGCPETPRNSLSRNSPRHFSLLGRNHYRNPANARVARMQVVIFIEDPVTGFNELTRADTHSGR
jgi:hypothetical protein